MIWHLGRQWNETIIHLAYTYTHGDKVYAYRQKAQPCFFFSCSLFHFLLPPPPPFYSVPFSCKSSSSSHVDVPGTRWLPEMTILCKFRGQLSSSSSFSFLYFISFFRTFLVFWILHTTTPLEKSALFSSLSSFLGCHCRKMQTHSGPSDALRVFGRASH